jgi:hypothetical protein
MRLRFGHAELNLQMRLPWELVVVQDAYTLRIEGSQNIVPFDRASGIVIVQAH